MAFRPVRAEILSALIGHNERTHRSGAALADVALELVSDGGSGRSPRTRADRNGHAGGKPGVGREAISGGRGWLHGNARVRPVRQRVLWIRRRVDGHGRLV